MINHFPPKVAEKQGDIFNFTVSKDFIPVKFDHRHLYNVYNNIIMFDNNPIIMLIFDKFSEYMYIFITFLL